MHRNLFVALLIVGLTGCPPDTFVDTDTGPTSDLDRDGFSIAEGDCDDGDATIYPGANDVVGDDIDQGCDGIDGVDADGDGMASQGTGGDDCNDNDDTIYPNAPEIGWDGIDQNCDDTDIYDFLQISAGRFHTCGVASNGLIRCWGGDVHGQSTSHPISVGWRRICSGAEFSCALGEDGGIACWGRNYKDSPSGEILTRQISDAPAELIYEQLSCGHHNACALAVDGTPKCWGDDEFMQITDTPVAQKMLSIAPGKDHVCAVKRTDEKLVCWGRDDPTKNFKATAADFNLSFDFIRVVSGESHSCAMRDDLGLNCWGDDSLNRTGTPNEAGPYSDVSSFGAMTCGTLEASDLVCWGGGNQFDELTDAPVYSQELKAVGVGYNHACALTRDKGEAVCWGRNLEGQATVPDWN